MGFMMIFFFGGGESRRGINLYLKIIRLSYNVNLCPYFLN